MGPSEICKWAYLEVGLFFGFPDSNKRLLCDDRAILTGGGDWRDGNDSDASEESDEVHSTEPMKLQLNILFFEAADASVCIRKPSHHVSPIKMPVGIP